MLIILSSEYVCLVVVVIFGAGCKSPFIPCSTYTRLAALLPATLSATLSALDIGVPHAQLSPTPQVPLRVPQRLRLGEL